MSRPFAPRRFGGFLLTAELGSDAAGRVYRALRLSDERDFVRLRMLESPEISVDAVLDAIQENGEIHTFLKNTAIAHGVQMDAADGIPFLAWHEPSGRTLDAVLRRAREASEPIPFEHALLIAEKVAAALDHSYSTMVDGERTLHGLVWPGFVAISDDGEVQLTGFGLAAGFFPSFSRSGFAQEVGAYLAPEEREGRAVGKNSDVYSVGALLLEMLTGVPPDPADPLAQLRGPEAPPLAPQLVALLKMCLAEPPERYQSVGELHRELGKLLFSGPYSPSTFNFAFYLNSLFASEIEAENAARTAEARLDPASIPEPIIPAPTAPRAPAARAPSDRIESSAGVEAGSRARIVWGSALLVTAAVGGAIYVIARKPAPRATPAPKPTFVAAAAIPTPVSIPTPSDATSGMTEVQFKDEVSRRVAQELKKLQEEMGKARPTEKAPAVDAASRSALLPPTVPAPIATAAPIARAEPTAPVPTAVPRSPEPTRIAAEEPPPAVVAKPEEEAPKILRIVKPVYPAIALKARIGGIVVLRVLVSETGSPIAVEVLKGVGGGLSEAAIAAVRHWSFEPARRRGVAVAAWTTIPIPFQP